VICRYRSRLLFVWGLSVAILFLLLGIAMVVPASGTNVAQHVIGGFAIAAACWGGGISLTNGVWLTPEAIVKRQGYRRTVIPWDTIESFSVGRVPRNQTWKTVLVGLRPQGSVYLSCLAGRERYIQRIIAEFEKYRSTLP
jgi:hypothetical protein